MPFSVAISRPGRAVPVLAGIAVLILLAVILAVVGTRAVRRPAAVTRPAAARSVRPAAAVPPVPTPAVEPLELLAMTPDRARAINAAIPLVAGRITPARPYRFAGSAGDRLAARACLASAAWYEAGDDPVGQPAVVQVVLNRVRHPAYPKTICGVVFQGAERRTGCQFSFTCDGAMARRPSAVAWARAEGVADKALAGFVDARVGNATHYHTDWVVPYWSATLDKIARVDTHLFFRWRGYWGTPAAFRGRYAGGEAPDPRVPGVPVPAMVPGMDGASPVLTFDVPPVPGDAILTLTPRPTLTIPGVSAATLQGSRLLLGSADGREFALELDAGMPPDGYGAIARALCGARPACTVAGWLDPASVPEATPLPPWALRVATFVYRRRSDDPAGTALWNCRQRPRADPAQCLPGTR